MKRAGRGSAGSSEGADGEAPRSENKSVHNDFTVNGRLDIEMDGFFQVRGVRITPSAPSWGRPCA